MRLSFTFATSSRKKTAALLAVLITGNLFLHAQASLGRPPRPAPRPPRVLRVPSEFATIQSAIDDARDGDTVIVGPRTYVEHVDFLGKAIEVVAPAGPLRTIIRPPGDGAVVRFHSGEGADSRLIGFTISNGSNYVPEGLAGGVSCIDPDDSVVANPYLSDCIITRNFSDQDSGGDGPAGLAGNATLERCILRDNNSTNYRDGGAAEGVLTLLQCVIEDNTGCTGGGIELRAGSIAEECIIRGNWAGPCGNRNGPLDAWGGGVFAASGAVLERCLIVDNTVAEGLAIDDPGICYELSHGGGVAGAGTLRQCTIVGNVADLCATQGGVDVGPTLVDCIVRANDDEPFAYGARPYRYSDVEGGAGGPGSFDADPYFTGGFRLAEGSPCIDRGDPASPLDPDGTRADVGAYYFPQGDAPVGVLWSERESLGSTSPTDVSFGRALAVSGDTLLVGAAQSDWNGNPGAATVFRRSSGVWSESQRLVPSISAEGDLFGGALDVDGNVAAVGAQQLETAGGWGVVVVFERPTADAPFVETAILDPGLPGTNARFGAAVALDDGTLVVGAHWNGFESLGRAYVYQRQRRGDWDRVAELAPEGQTVDWGEEAFFGAELALEGTTLVVGAPFGGDPFFKSGAAFVFERAGRSPHSWVPVATLAPHDPVARGGFGGSVSLAGDTVVVGSHTGADTFERRGPGLPWQPAQRLQPAEFPSQSYQYSSPTVLVDGDRLWLSRRPGSLGHNHGLIWEYVRANAGAPWREAAQFGPMSWDYPAPFAFSEGTLFVGRTSEIGAPVGHVRVFVRGPEVDSVALDQAALFDPVVLSGRALDEVTAVRIGGVPEAIRAQSATELVIRPSRRDPGFTDLTLETASGAITLTRGLRSVPTLAATTDGVGGTLDVELVNGAPGNYALSYSLDLRSSIFTLTNPPTWYGSWLQNTPGRSGRLATDAFDVRGRAVRSFLVPSDPALTGLTLYLQARCRRGLFGSLGASFTNLTSVTL